MAEENNQDTPKIHVDSDWKAQARAEKEKLAAQTEQAAADNKQAAAKQQGESQRPPLPKASFTTLISSLLSQVLFALGAYQDPQTGKPSVDLELAKHHIDTLKVIEEKTEGNLSEEEKGLLDRALYQARMQFVQVSQSM